MNISLYLDILKKLDELSEEERKPDRISLLIGKWSNREYPIDMISVLCAFYNYMEEKPEYNFIHNSESWNEFFRLRFANYFTIDVIKSNFDTIILHDKIVDIILEFTPENVQREFYSYAESVKELNKDKKVNIYEALFENIKSKLTAKGIIKEAVDEKKAEEIPTSVAPEEKHEPVRAEKMTSEELSEQIKLLTELRKTRRDTYFGDVARDLGVDARDLIELVGEEASYEIGGIDIYTEVLDQLTSNDEKVASLPNNMLKKLAERLNKSVKLKQMGFEIVKDKTSVTLVISKKDTVFDKIATTSQKVYKDIKKGSKFAGHIAVGGVIIGALATDEIIKYVKKASDFVDKKVSATKTSLAPKVAEGLRTVADSISPQPEIILGTEESGYTAQQSDPNVILSAGTQVGNIPNPGTKTVVK